MAVLLMLMLAYGPCQWSMPWWLWILAAPHTLGEGFREMASRRTA